MSEAAERAVEAVRAKAIALLVPGLKLALATDADTFARGKRPSVLVAIARPEYSVVVAIDASEYDGVAIAVAAGFPLPPRRTAQQVLTERAGRA